MKTTDSTRKLNEALALLSEAARDKQTAFRELLEGNYSDLSNALQDAESNIESRAQQTARRARELGQEAVDEIRDKATRVDRKVHDDPWKAMGWAVVAAFATGFLFGRKE